MQKTYVEKIMEPEPSPEPDSCSIHEKIIVCRSIYCDLQSAILSMQTSMELAIHLPEYDIRLIAQNVQALLGQLGQIGAYSEALQVRKSFKMRA
jgi:hypothetical protein